MYPYKVGEDLLKIYGFRLSTKAPGMMEKLEGSRLVLYKKGDNGNYTKEFDDELRLFKLSTSEIKHPRQE